MKFIIVNSIFLTATLCLKCTAFKERKSTEVRAIIVCLAIPGKIVGVEYLKDGARSGRVQFGGIIRPVSLDFVPEASEGDYVMVHVGFPISRVNAEEAERTYSLLAEMGALREEFPEFEVPPSRSRPTHLG